jgi:hypothetical protein
MFGSNDHRHAIVDLRGKFVRRCRKNSERGNGVVLFLVPNVPKAGEKEWLVVCHPNAIVALGRGLTEAVPGP